MVLSSHDRAVLDTGFAGTVQAFVPFDLLDTFRERMDAGC